MKNDYQRILTEKRGKAAIIRFNIPENGNRVDRLACDEIGAAIAEANSDAEVRAIVLTGVGEVFCLGGKIDGFPVGYAMDQKVYCDSMVDMLKAVYRSAKPVIAAINGYCLGGGIELALVCDLRIASEKASFGLPEAKLGVIPSYGGTQRLTRLCGAALAKDLCFTCRRMPADEALSWHLINRLVPHEQLMDEATKYMEEILANAPIALKYCKYSINNGAEISLEKGLEIEKLSFAMCIASEDCAEGMAAFAEKREPQFKNR